MPDKPVKATLADLAKEIGATVDEIGQLSSEARQLTKGQLLELWGVTGVSAAIDAYHKSHEGKQLPSPSAETATAADVPLRLTLQDVRSIQQIFTPERVQAALGSTGTSSGAASAANVYACCCPCCTSAATLETLAS